jgi:hypothetical protein
MTAVCLRCDWEGEEGHATCPRCGAPLFRSGPPRAGRRAAAPPAALRVPPRRELEPSGPAADDASASEPVARAPTSVRAALAVAVAVFGVIALAIAGGGGEPQDRRLPTGPVVPPVDRASGILVYAVPDGAGNARLWLWHRADGDVTEGPLIREPLEIVNVRSPGYGWLGYTADLGDGGQEAVILDSLEPDAEERPIGLGDVVSWVREGATAVFLERGPLRAGCRRDVVVTAVHVDIGGDEVVFDDTICGDILTVGRTSLGYFLTWARPGEAHVVQADVVGAGYRDAGLLLADHGVIAISPGGEMLVTPSSGFVSRNVPARDDVRPVAGTAWSFELFGGAPVPILVRGAPLHIDRVLAYPPGSAEALVVGRLSGDPPGLWEVPLGEIGSTRKGARYVGPVEGSTAAAYAADGTGFVVTGGELWEIRPRRMVPLELPEGAPPPNGPIAWILREPLTQLGPVP